MTGIFKHVLFFMVLAAACYVLANFVPGRVGFIVFLAIGMLAELAFYVFSFRRHRSARAEPAGSRT